MMKEKRCPSGGWWKGAGHWRGLHCSDPDQTE
jgi:hypothetical protein